MDWRTVTAVVIAVLAGACGSAETAPTTEPTTTTTMATTTTVATGQAPPASPEVVEFVADPATLAYGESAELSWSTRNAGEVLLTGYLDGEVERIPVDASGSLATGPLEGTETYTLTLRGRPGADPERVEVELTVEVEPPPEIALRCSPGVGGGDCLVQAPPAAGRCAEIEWTAERAHGGVYLNGEEVDASGSRTYCELERSSTFEVVARALPEDDAPEVRESVRVEVRPAPPSDLSGEIDREVFGTRSALRLTWQDNSPNEDGFRVWRCQAGDCELVEELGQNVTEATIELLPGSRRYCSYSYAVNAFNDAGPSGRATLDGGALAGC